MHAQNLYRFFRFLFAIIWLVNGLICKVFGLVPRHEAIVSNILGSTYAGFFTMLIGFAEIGMAIWIWIGFLPRFNAWTQIIIIMTMNIMEWMLVPDLLLWGRFNLVFSALLCATIYYVEFKLKPKSIR
ncbi:DoxX-like family protein [Sphingobacterium corticis]|uniref:DoxX-like family protein n=1 Tax=Sphingobacterium corticis TaxID=1812823 RepID=A0ABW5NLI6_9SPHI